MATQTINYLHQIDQSDQIDKQVAEHTIVDRGSQLNGSSQLVTNSIIGSSRWAEKARRLVAAHSAQDNTVIFEVQPGTVKHFLASLIHQCSRYSEGPFVSVTLGSTTDETARTVLFGRVRMRVDALPASHCPGSEFPASKFTASEIPGSEKGLIELAAGGTLYIDGLLDTSHSLIGDVARFIENAGLNCNGAGSVRILFGITTHYSRCQPRTPIDLRSQYMNGDRIQIPPLRERQDDIEVLAAHFVKQCCEQSRKELRAISQNAVGALINYDWPRNVAELVSVVNQLVRQSNPPSLDLALLPAYMQRPGNGTNTIAAVDLDLDEEVKQFEINLICAALRQSRGLQNKAAQLLRIRPTTLFMKIKRYGIDVADFRQRAERSAASCLRAFEEPD